MGYTEDLDLLRSITSGRGAARMDENPDELPTRRRECSRQVSIQDGPVIPDLHPSSITVQHTHFDQSVAYTSVCLISILVAGFSRTLLFRDPRLVHAYAHMTVSSRK